jgi:integration host factor subunit alpha
VALTKASIIEKVSEKIILPPAQTKDTVEHLIEVMKSTLEEGEDLMITGFGKFQVNDKSPRKGRNPATGEDMTLDKRRVVTFKCSGMLRDQINGNTHE